MKKNNLIRIIFFVVFVCLILVILFRDLYLTKQEQKHTVSVIVGEAGTERYMALQQGLESAAKDYNLQVNFYATSKSNDVQEQITLIEKELDKKVDAIILNAVDSTKIRKILEEKEYFSKIILLETDLEPTQLFPKVSCDNYQMGYDLASKMIEDTTISKVGIVMETDLTEAMKSRMDGIKQVIADQGNITIEWIVDSTTRIATAQWFYDKLPVDAVICLDSSSTMRMVDSLQEKDPKGKIYGFGSNETNVYYMDKELIRALIVPNDFNMGYVAMQTASYRVKKSNVPTNQEVSYLLVTKDTLYEKDQQIIFSFIQ